MEPVKGLNHQEQLRELWGLSLEKRRLTGELLALYKSLTGESSQVGLDLFSQATSDQARGNSLNLHQESFSLDIRRNFFMERVVKHWNGQPRAEMEPPSLETFKKHLHVALSALVYLTRW